MDTRIESKAAQLERCTGARLWMARHMGADVHVQMTVAQEKVAGSKSVHCRALECQGHGGTSGFFCSVPLEIDQSTVMFAQPNI